MNEWTPKGWGWSLRSLPTLAFCGCLQQSVKWGPNAYLQRSQNYFLFLHSGRQNMPQVDLEQFLLTTGYTVKRLAKSSILCGVKKKRVCMKKIKDMSLQLWSTNVWKMKQVKDSIMSPSKKNKSKWRAQDAKHCSEKSPEHLQQALHLCTSPTMWSGLTLWFWGPGCQSIIGVLPVESPLKGWMRSPGEGFWFLLPSISTRY